MLAESYRPRGAPPGIDWKKALVDPGTRPCWLEGRHCPPAPDRYMGCRSRESTVPDVAMVTACAAS